MATPFVGEIRAFGFNFAPKNWMICAGQLLQISQNTALFSILGTTYGGNGVQTFGLPDLRGRTPVHPDNSSVILGTQVGQESVTLIGNQIGHSHPVAAVSGAGNSSAPVGDLPAGAGATMYGATADTAMNAQIVGPAGGNGAHENRQPSLVLTYCIALFGVFPSRN